MTNPTSPRWERDALATWNERMKLLANSANSANALGLGGIGLGILRPIIIDDASWFGVNWWWLVLGIAFHALGHYALWQLQKRREPE